MRRNIHLINYNVTGHNKSSRNRILRPGFKKYFTCPVNEREIFKHQGASKQRGSHGPTQECDKNIAGDLRGGEGRGRGSPGGERRGGAGLRARLPHAYRCRVIVARKNWPHDNRGNAAPAPDTAPFWLLSFYPCALAAEWECVWDYLHTVTRLISFVFFVFTYYDIGKMKLQCCYRDVIIISLYSVLKLKRFAKYNIRRDDWFVTIYYFFTILEYWQVTSVVIKLMHSQKKTNSIQNK